MNILPLNTYKYQTPVFGAKKSKKEEIGPEKLNFTEVDRIANKSNTDYLDLLRGVLVKKEYNRFAPKIIRAASLKELAELKEWIASSFLYKASEDLLMQLMEKKKF